MGHIYGDMMLVNNVHNNCVLVILRKTIRKKLAKPSTVLFFLQVDACGGHDAFGHNVSPLL